MKRQPNYKKLFIQLYIDAARCEAPEGTQLDDVLAYHQSAFDRAEGINRPQHGPTLPPARRRYGVTQRGERVLRAMSALVTITVCSMALAVACAVVLAWMYDWKVTW